MCSFVKFIISNHYINAIINEQSACNNDSDGVIAIPGKNVEGIGNTNSEELVSSPTSPGEQNSVIREQEEAKEVRETYVKDGQETKEEAQKGGKETQEGSEEKVVQESEKVIIKEVKDSSYYNRR